MGGFRLFVVVGIPLIIGSLVLCGALYFFFPNEFKECCPCVIQRKPVAEIVEVPTTEIVIIEVPVDSEIVTNSKI